LQSGRNASGAQQFACGKEVNWWKDQLQIEIDRSRIGQQGWIWYFILEKVAAWHTHSSENFTTFSFSQLLIAHAGVGGLK